MLSYISYYVIDYMYIVLYRKLLIQSIDSPVQPFLLMGVVVCVDGIPLVYPVNIENTCGGMNTE